MSLPLSECVCGRGSRGEYFQFTLYSGCDPLGSQINGEQSPTRPPLWGPWGLPSAFHFRKAAEKRGSCFRKTSEWKLGSAHGWPPCVLPPTQAPRGGCSLSCQRLDALAHVFLIQLPSFLVAFSKRLFLGPRPSC